jgi:hypothetical protein
MDHLGPRAGHATAAEQPGAPGRYRAIDDPIQDALFRLILSLGAEVWVLKDRLALLEEALAGRGIPAAELIEELSGRPARGEQVRPGRDAFLNRFLAGIERGAAR